MLANEQRNELRDTAHLHASEMCKSDWCPRASMYRMRGVEPDDPEKSISWFTANIYEEGHDIHDKYQRLMWDAGVLEGMFACILCGHHFYETSPHVCPQCFLANVERPVEDKIKLGRRLLRYAEVPLVSDELMLIGHADGIAVLDRGKAVVEIKSIGEGTLRMEVPGMYDRVESKEISLRELWAEIKRPFQSHLRQAYLYSYVLGIKRVIFIYEAKWSQAQKEFAVTFQPGVVDDMLEQARKVKQAMQTGRLVQRPDWAVDEQWRTCRKCPFRKTCWKVEDDVEVGEAPAAAVERRVRVLPRPS